MKILAAQNHVFCGQKEFHWGEQFWKFLVVKIALYGQKEFHRGKQFWKLCG